jgi:2-hydroxychromene-2-carboxylate isomerase
MATQTPVELFFDPSCPFTWRTSRWITEVAASGAAALTLRVMSLPLLNADKADDPEWAPFLEQGTRVLRALVAAEAAAGQEGIGKLYSVLGTRRHEKDEHFTDETVAAAVADIGLPASVAAAVDDESLDATIRASHEAGQAAVGQESGTPILRIGEKAWFGPVVVPAPTGAEALRLFEAVRLLATVPSFSELKTSRTDL